MKALPFEGFFTKPTEPECYGVCARCGTDGVVWLVSGEWRCWRGQCNREEN